MYHVVMNTLTEVFQSIHAERLRRIEGKDIHPLTKVAQERPSDCELVGFNAPGADFYVATLRWSGKTFEIWYTLSSAKLHIGGVFLPADRADTFWTNPLIQEELFRKLWAE